MVAPVTRCVAVRLVEMIFRIIGPSVFFEEDDDENEKEARACGITDRSLRDFSCGVAGKGPAM
jgi:hypothetical protein